MPIGTGIVYNVGDLILSQVSSSGTAFLETKIAAATSSLIYFDSNARINSASLNSITVGTASYVSGSNSIITNITASNISASGTGSFGMVGIGTVNPAYKLDVNGNANFTNGFYTNTDASSTSYFVGANGTRPIIFQNNTATSYDFGFKFTDSNTFTIVGGNTLANPTTDLVSFKYDGKVGIGTTNPSALLHIYTGSLGSTAYPLLIDNSSGGAGVNVVGIGFANGGIMKHSITTAIYGNDYMAFNVGQGASYNQERMRIDSNGNVGIGMISPTTKLHVSGSITALDGAFISNVTSGTDRYFLNCYGTSTNWIFSLYENNNTAYLNSYSNMAFRANQNGGSGGYFIFSGANVGIGTTIPNNKLDIWGGTGTTLNMANVDDSGRGGKLTFISSSVTGRQFYVGTNSSIYNLVFGIDSIEKMRLDTSGNLGIGTTSPGSRLEVQFPTNPATDNGAGNNVLRVWTSASFAADVGGAIGLGGTYNTSSYQSFGQIAGRKTNALSSSNAGYLQFATTNTTGTMTEWMRIDAGGNVGIGTTNPITKFHVYAAANGNNWASFAGNVGATLPSAHTYGVLIGSNYSNGLSESNIVWGHGISSNQYFAIGKVSGSTSYSEQLRIDVNGNVGIGTTVPVNKLQVNGNVSGSSFTSSISNAVGFLGTSSWAQNVVSASYALSSSFATTAQTANALNPANSYTIAGLTVNGNISASGTISASNLRVVGTANVIELSQATAGSATYYVMDNTVETGGRRYRFGYSGGSSDKGSFTIYNQTDNITPFTITTSGSVGIGTTNAGTKLEVYGVVRVTESTSGGILQLTAGASAVDIASTFYGGSRRPITFTMDNEKMRITNSGSLLIGDTTQGYSPITLGYMLGVKSQTSQTFISIAKSGQTLDSGGMILGLDTTSGYLWMRESISLSFGTTNSEKMVITNTGNVGIGTTIPTAKLQISKIGDNGSNGLVDYGIITVSSGSTTQATLGAETIGDGYSNLNLGSNIGGVRTFWHISKRLSSASTPHSLEYFYYDGTTFNQRFTFTTDGNLGIGTVIPVAKLQVNGNVSGSSFTSSISNAVGFLGTSSWAQNVVSASFATTAQTANALNASNTYTIAGLTSAYVDVNGSATIPSTGIYRPSSKTLGLSADATLILKINGSVSPYVTSIETGNFLVQSGNVGIGTTNATDKLTLYGELASYKTGADTIQTQVYLANAGNTRAFNLQLNSGGTGLDLWSYNSANAWLRHTTFNYDGNVGIGTAVPAAKLEITGSSNSALLNIKSPISGAILYVSGSGAVGIGTSAVGAFTLQVSGSFGATTKSFIIDHPTKEGKKLMYGSLESPYHGIRLTGRDTLVNGKCKVELPEYMYKLILHDSVNIQLTGIKCNKTLYIDDINIPENYFTIAYDKALFESYKDYDFFWDFTAIRADVPELQTEM